MVHVHIIPDCPSCGGEMSLLTQGHDHTDKEPWGTWFTAYYLCPACKWQSDRVRGETRAEAIGNIMDAYGEKSYSVRKEDYNGQ